MKTVTCTFNPLEFKLVPIELLNAVEHLLKCKGRFHTEQNFNALKSAHFDYSTMPGYPADTGWISVDNRLPEIGIPVLAMVGKNIYALARIDYDEGWLWSIGSSDLSNAINYEADDDYQPSCWMPLPPAPEAV